MQPKKSDLEANALGKEKQLLVVLRKTKHCSLELCISARDNLANILQEFYAEDQLENLSL